MATKRRQWSEMDSTERRIRAAMVLAGVDTFEDLAALIDQRNLGESKLRRLSDETARANLIGLRAIADACGLPPVWFSVDFSRLAELEATPVTTALSEVRDQLRQMQARLAALEAGATPPFEEEDPPSEGPQLGTP